MEKLLNVVTKLLIMMTLADEVPSVISLNPFLLVHFFIY
jgi:hypothetical protein